MRSAVYRSHILLFCLCWCMKAHAQIVETGTYVMYQGDAEVSREIYSFDGTTLADTVNIPSRGIRMESVARYDAELAPVSYSLDLFQGGGDVAVQHVDVSFSDTAAVWSTETQLGDSSAVSPVRGPYAFMQNLVFAHLAVVLLRYDRDRGGTQHLNVWMPEQGGLSEVAMEFTSGTNGTVDIGNARFNVMVDEDGWLRRATVPAQNVSVESSNRGAAGS